MSRRAVLIEEDFDDDTDLPLPSHPLPNTGNIGPLLQELDITDDESEPPNQRAGPASPPHAQPAFRTPPGPNSRNTVTDITPYKSWTCVYPIYIDAKRAYGTGQRRVPRANAVWWPLSKDIADAANSMGLPTLHEVNKSHPRDWENPGRVRVQWKKDGKLVNPMLKTKKLLLQQIAAHIQSVKPQHKPVPPFQPALNTTPAPTPAPASKSGKGKQLLATAPKKRSATRQAPAPPLPHPPLATRVSPYSPALASGMLVDAVKAGMAAQAQEVAVGAGQPGTVGQQGPGMQKGKRKVVRVRG
ncbi:signal recognition particle, SRP19 subunit [Mycena pura]|uniref:Signal recognition particle, SRP19 subunit n=1 Tax=Mycena pura TaxID=153505 RepID=A0AAD6YC44_9AGAR|nr:signal recognition particle, SRP19 subunit [Mycena pura]